MSIRYELFLVLMAVLTAVRFVAVQARGIAITEPAWLIAWGLLLLGCANWLRNLMTTRRIVRLKSTQREALPASFAPTVRG